MLTGWRSPHSHLSTRPRKMLIKHKHYASISKYSFPDYTRKLLTGNPEWKPKLSLSHNASFSNYSNNESHTHTNTHLNPAYVQTAIYCTLVCMILLYITSDLKYTTDEDMWAMVNILNILCKARGKKKKMVKCEKCPTQASDRQTSKKLWRSCLPEEHGANCAREG